MKNNLLLIENKIYYQKTRNYQQVVLFGINEEAQTAEVLNVKTREVQTKTLYWCRKNLVLKK